MKIMNKKKEKKITRVKGAITRAPSEVQRYSGRVTTVSYSKIPESVKYAYWKKKKVLTGRTESEPVRENKIKLVNDA